MSHRKRLAAEPAPDPTLRQRAASGIGLFIRENVRAMLVFAGIVTWAQAIIPWTNDAMDRIVFGFVGAALLGLALPRRLWR